VVPARLLYLHNLDAPALAELLLHSPDAQQAPQMRGLLSEHLLKVVLVVS
jgi:hypothetical protein